MDGLTIIGLAFGFCLLFFHLCLLLWTPCCLAKHLPTLFQNHPPPEQTDSSVAQGGEASP
jgi:hypothetical protein